MPAPSSDPTGQGGDALVDALYQAGLTVNRVVFRWLLDMDIPLLAAGVLLTLDPEDAPIGAGEVAEAIGISVNDATLALHELRSLGYAEEEKRRYSPTELGRKVHASLAEARRAALAAEVARLPEAHRRALARSLGNEGVG